MIRRVVSAIVIAASTGIVFVPAAAHADNGCSVAPPTSPGTTLKATMQSGGIKRTYLLHLPSDYRQGEARPLILAFHGRGQTPKAMQTYTALDKLPAITVYPQGTETGDDQLGWQGAPYS